MLPLLLRATWTRTALCRVCRPPKRSTPTSPRPLLVLELELGLELELDRAPVALLGTPQWRRYPLPPPPPCPLPRPSCRRSHTTMDLWATEEV
jgi:hypothetical protein